MMIFLGKAWKLITQIRNGIANFIFLCIVIVIIVAVFSSDKKPLPNSAPLLVTITGQLVDERTYQPSIIDIMEEKQEAPETLVRDVVKTINHAANDKRISTLIFNLNHLRGGSLSKLEEIGQAVTRFKKSGKPVIAYADHYSQHQYFLASYADTIYLNALGEVALTGFGYFGSYFKEAADKLSIKFHLFKVGDYKDAAEPFVRNNMSEASREHNASWINELWGRYTGTVESNRGLTSEAIQHHIESLTSPLKNAPQDFSNIALEAGLVDHVVSRVALFDQLRAQFGEDKDTGYFKAIGWKRYLNHIQPNFSQPDSNIGLIVATGSIVDGHAPEGQIGGDSLSHLIQQARDDDSLEALIIRIDSPGGSAFASEVIREQIVATRQQGLPVYISMGSVAASGGYWIATAADEIWAQPTTITGSIGVWGLVPNFSGSMQRLGIHNDGFGTTPLADIYQLSRPMSDDAKQVFQSGVENIYRKFIGLVAEARQQTPETIHEIAQGRVWTGEKAHALGLVDQMGTLNDLISAIEQKHQLEQAKIKRIQRPLSPREQFMKALVNEASFFGKIIGSEVFPSTLSVIAKEMTPPITPLISHTTQDKLNVYAHCLGCEIVP